MNGVSFPGAGAATPTPTITSLSPTHGIGAGGTALTITGTGFQASCTVTVGGVAATSVVRVSDTSVTCVTPAEAGAFGPDDVVVTNPDGRGSTSRNFGFDAPTVSAITPSIGTTLGGTSITDLAGTGFVTGATVTIGGVAATSVAFVSSIKLTCATPAHALEGAVDVVVTNPDGQAATGAGLFTYSIAPTITSLSVATGADIGGTAVTITGTGFKASPAVTFGGVTATSIVRVSSTSITCVTPAGTVGARDVVVTNADTLSVTDAAAFTYFFPEWNSETPLVDWNMANAVVTGGSLIDSVPNAGTGGSALTGVASNKPTRVTASANFNGYDSASFPAGGATANRFSFTALGNASGGPMSVYVVAKGDSSVATNYYAMSVGSNLGVYRRGASGNFPGGYISTGATHLLGAGARAWTSSQIVALTLASGTQRIYDSSATEGGNDVSVGFVDAAGVVGTHSSASDTFTFRGEIVRILVFNTLHDATARAAVMAALGTKYGITIV